MLPIPQDITDLIFAQWAEGANDPDLNQILPPEAVRLAVLVESGITAAPQDYDGGSAARDWCEAQQKTQTEAMLVRELLNKVEPRTEEHAKTGSLPAWSIKPWASTLLFDWSDGLSEAVDNARIFLAKQKVPTQ
jgi:hypothetical protein